MKVQTNPKRKTISTPEQALTMKEVSIPIGGNVTPPLLREKSPDPVSAREERSKYPPYNEYLGDENL